jgi:hypothetical protein
MKEKIKMESKIETEKEYDVRFPVTMKFPICTTATHTGTHIIPSSSQNKNSRLLKGFIHSISDCAEVKKYLELYRLSPIFLVWVHTRNIETKFCQNNMYKQRSYLNENTKYFRLKEESSRKIRALCEISGSYISAAEDQNLSGC